MTDSLDRMAASDGSGDAVSAAAPAAPVARWARSVLHALNGARLWFRAWRRTRPFWGAFWTLLAGAEIVNFMSFSFGLALTGGWAYSAGYVMGGGLILMALTALVTPHYKALAGVLAFLLALGAFPTANLGGYLLGSVLGIIGSSMIWSWGPKGPRGASRRARRVAVESGS